MRAICSSVLCTLAFATSPQMSARNYYEELKSSGAFNRYIDEFVCFDENDSSTFKTMARVDDIIAKAQQVGDSKMVQAMQGKENKVVMKPYVKGIGGDLELYDPQDDAKTSYINLTSYPKTPAKHQLRLMVKTAIVFNWATGRYRYTTTYGGRTDVVPPKTAFGKCEPLNPEMGH